MNDRSDIERVLTTWFDDGPSRMPDRVVDIVADRVGRQSQRRAWRLDWRRYVMNTNVKIAAALAAVLVVAVLGYNLLPGTSTGVGGSAPTQSPSPSVAGTPAWDNNPQCGEKGCGGPQTAGTYTSRALKPAVTYTLTNDWVNVRDWPDFFMLYPDTPANRALAAVGDYAPYIVILPGPTKVSPSAACAAGSVIDGTEVDAAQFVEFLTTRQNLATTEPERVTVAGLSGQQIDASVEPGWTGCLPGAPIGESLTQQDRVRFIVLDTTDRGTLMIRLRALADSATFFAEAMPVIESFEFGVAP